MNILKLIKNRKAIRKYQNKKISNKVIVKIIQAGTWGPALLAPGFQPWKFFVVQNRNIINLIGNELIKKAEKIGAGGNIVLRSTANTIYNAQIIIIIYNTGSLVKFACGISKFYKKFAATAEISAISAAIQNMILAAETLHIGSCWLDTPVFCMKEINDLLKVDGQLVAILTLGYPSEKGRRSKRKDFSEVVKYIR